MPRDTLIGCLVDGRYEVNERIARGGMATVYRAVDRRLERDVALKVMHPHLAESEDFVNRFRREARAAARLSHPHVVGVYDQGLWQDSFYLTMEFVDGHDLRSELATEGALTLGRALQVTQAVLDALAAAHRRGLVHRDIKPENVMVTLEGTIKVADFGLARAVSEATAASTGTVLGTVAYLAPELVTHGQASPASDVYAVGIMLFEMLTGHQPFTGDLPINVAFQHVNSVVPSPSRELEWLPTEVDDLVAALTAHDPAERLADGEAAITATRRVIGTLSGDVLARRGAGTTSLGAPRGTDERVSTASLEERPSSGTVALPVGGIVAEQRTPVRRRRRWRWATLLVVLLTAGVAAGWYLLLGPGASIPTPAVVGLTEGDARAILVDNDLTVATEEAYDDFVPAGEVISTDPGPGEPVARGGEVTIVVSQGIRMIEVPPLEGTTAAAATAALLDAGFPEPVVKEAYDQAVPAGTVISASAQAGESLPHTTAVDITVSLGREPVETPDVANLPEAEAAAALEAAGLVVARGEEYSDAVPEGAVIRQEPTGQLYRGDTVTITVSLGRPFATVPSVFGMGLSQATKTLEDAGFVVAVETVWGGSLGVVRFQDPAEGQQARLGSTVTITVV